MLPQVKEEALGDEVEKHDWVLLNENNERPKQKKKCVRLLNTVSLPKYTKHIIF